MASERCPHCRAILPPPKTCASESCGKTFYRGEGGRADAAYCSERCAGTARMRRYRERHPGT